MSLREEDRQKNGCSSRGLGLAAAAIGVGVGAALYYFFSKSPENPSSEGASSQGWGESPQTFNESESSSSISEHSESNSFSSTSEQPESDSFSTISEHTTTDTSFENCSVRININIEDESDNDEDISMNDYESYNDSDMSVESNESDHLSSSSSDSDVDMDTSESSDSESSVWEIESSSDVPYHSSNHNRHSSFRNFIDGIQQIGMSISPILSPRLQLISSPRITRRERSWTLEECSICFELILRNQEVMSLPCTHHFHQACILPWLQEQQTCPNCRKTVDI
ncbi:uncharacterized protein LOC112044887 isoform X2 [Bicyclus anynana]|uniref:Uncharacterized protein LOC112044887 isoform X2 n=1 Tax=Bicyclus anynana TaxID=110368 RepID=A0ABM3M4X7_BICAN|nr:uncharacterized protein LOC112044887 isoform X2 [Bicyclus anynana]